MSYDNPKVSVIIPVYNAEKYLRECLDSVVNQTLKDIEIICVDDCSADSSASILAKYADKDPRIKVIYYPENKSASQARKDGVMLATGKYIMFMDSDDRLELDACKKLSEEMDSHDVDILQFGTYIDALPSVPSDSVAFFERFAKPHIQMLEGREVFEACFVRQEYRFNLWNKIYKTQLCKKAFAEIADGYFPKAQDLYAFFILAWYANSYLGIKTKLYHYNYGSGITGGKQLISLDKFKRHCSQQDVAQKCREFLIAQDAWDTYKAAWEKLNRNLANECVGRWLNQLSSADNAAGFDELVDHWGMEYIVNLINTTFHDQLDSAIKKSADSQHPIALFLASQGEIDPKDASVPDGFDRVIPVIMATNDKYAPYAGVAIESIAENAGPCNYYRIYVLHTGISIHHIQMLELLGSKQLSVQCVNIDQLIENKEVELYEKSHFTREMYYRFVIPELFGFFRLVVYLDCDLIINCDIADIMNSNITDDYLIAGVRNPMRKRKRKRMTLRFQIDPDDNINSGVLIINVHQWNIEKTAERCFDILRTTSQEILEFPDQDIINIVCNKRILHLDESWNFFWHMIYGDDEFISLCAPIAKKVGENFRILHFASDIKPWSSPQLPLSRYFWKYARQTPFYEEILMNSFTATTIQNRVSVYRDSSPKPMDYQEKTIMELRQEIKEIHSSWSYRIGRFITFIPRKIRGGIRCYREHGWDYTFERFLIHMKIHKE